MCVSLSNFSIRVRLDSWNEFGNVPSSSIFWKTLRRISINSSLYEWYNLPVKPSGPEFFVYRFITDSISFLVISLFKLSTSSWFSFGGMYVSRNLFISSMLVYTCSLYSLMVFSISAVLVAITSFPFILFIWVLFLFFLVSLASGLPILFTLSKNQLLVLLIFSIFKLYFIYFLSDLHYFLPSADFRFCLLFLF